MAISNVNNVRSMVTVVSKQPSRFSLILYDQAKEGKYYDFDTHFFLGYSINQ